MTLVELLVVLVILAGLATSVGMSASSMLDRSRGERALREGESMRDALTRPDGLGLALDIGRMIDPSQPGELSLLATRNFKLDVLRTDGLASGPLDVDSAGMTVRAPLFRQYDLASLARSVTNTVQGASFRSFTNALFAADGRHASMTIGAGWRGPYCTAARQDGETGLLVDPFGGYWDFSAVDGMLCLSCYGQDRLSESDVYAETNDWRSADIVVPVAPANIPVTLHVEARHASDDAAAEGVRVHCLAPRLDAQSLENDADGVPCCTIVGQYVCGTNRVLSVSASGDSSEITQDDGLTVGTWAVFLCSTNAQSTVRSVRTVVVRPGLNTVRFCME